MPRPFPREARGPIGEGVLFGITIYGHDCSQFKLCFLEIRRWVCCPRDCCLTQLGPCQEPKRFRTQLTIQFGYDSVCSIFRKVACICYARPIKIGTPEIPSHQAWASFLVWFHQRLLMLAASSRYLVSLYLSNQ